MDRESLRKIQSIRLKKTVERVYHDTPFYRKKMQELGITPDDINSIDDIVNFPLPKYDLRDNYPFRPVCRADEPDCTYPRFVGDNRKAYCGGLHP